MRRDPRSVEIRFVGRTCGRILDQATEWIVKGRPTEVAPSRQMPTRPPDELADGGVFPLVMDDHQVVLVVMGCALETLQERPPSQFQTSRTNRARCGLVYDNRERPGLNPCELIEVVCVDQATLTRRQAERPKTTSVADQVVGLEFLAHEWAEMRLDPSSEADQAVVTDSPGGRLDQDAAEYETNWTSQRGWGFRCLPTRRRRQEARPDVGRAQRLIRSRCTSVLSEPRSPELGRVWEPAVRCGR